jgi:hypothetical protein
MARSMRLINYVVSLNEFEACIQLLKDFLLYLDRVEPRKPSIEGSLYDLRIDIHSAAYTLIAAIHQEIGK